MASANLGVHYTFWVHSVRVSLWNRRVLLRDEHGLPSSSGFEPYVYQWRSPVFCILNQILKIAEIDFSRYEFMRELSAEDFPIGM